MTGERQNVPTLTGEGNPKRCAVLAGENEEPGILLIVCPDRDALGIEAYGSVLQREIARIGAGGCGCRLGLVREDSM